LIRRRKFFAAAATAGAGAALTVAAPAVHAQATVRWRMTSSFPKSLDTIYGASEVLVDRVAKLSENKFQIRLFAAGEIVPGLQAADAVQAGTVECCHTASYYYVGKDKSFAFGTSIPFGLNARQQNAWIYDGGGQALLDEFYGEYNIVSFLAGNTGAQMGGWFRNEVPNLAALRGIKMRIPGIGGEILARLGAVPQTLAGGDIYPALERGTIDATEWVGPYDDEKLGFYRVAKNYYYPGFWEPGPGLHAFVNKEKWNALPAGHKEIFQSACREANLWMLTKYDAVNPPAMQRLIANGVTFRPFAQDILEAAYREANALYAEEAARNPKFRKIFEPWSAYRQEQARWFAVTEFAHETFTAGHLPPR
jgi:TRAP-type mannitol/chloroaromatic compound transport system substrate-binding protein